MTNLVEHRQQTSRAVTVAFRKSPAEARRKLGELLLPDLVDKLRGAIQRNEAWAISKGLEIAEMCGQTPMIVVNLMQALGVRDEAELRARVETAKRLDALSEATVEQQAQDAMAVLRQCVMASPSILGSIEAFCASLRTGLSGAEVIEEPHRNGDGGHGAAS